MKKTFCFCNQKGGCGKTTLSHNFSAGLAAKGKKILMIDLDSQGNLSFILGASPDHASIYDVLMGSEDARTAIQKSSIKNMDVLSSSIALSGFDKNSIEATRLKKAIAPVLNSYDYIVIDCPPSLGTLSVNAMMAADGVIIPALPDVFSLQAVSQIFQTIDYLKKNGNPALTITGIALTRYMVRRNLTKEAETAIESMAKQNGTRVFNTRISEAVAISEAQSARMSIYEYAPRTPAAEQFNSLIKEITR